MTRTIPRTIRIIFTIAFGLLAIDGILLVIATMLQLNDTFGHINPIAIVLIDVSGYGLMGGFSLTIVGAFSLVMQMLWHD